MASLAVTFKTMVRLEAIWFVDDEFGPVGEEGCIASGTCLLLSKTPG